MKKRILTLLLLGCLALSACGKDTETKDTQADADVAADAEDETEKDNTPITDDTVADKGIDAFMSLGDYKGIALTKTVYTVSEDDIENQILEDLDTYPMEMDDPEATVAMNDTINLDYSGSIDGVVFDGGTAENQQLKIGSGQFIDGFEDQMIGMKVGESGEITVTFPEQSHSADLAGKEAVFAVTVNSIVSRPLDAPTDEWVKENFELNTVDEYREDVKVRLEEENELTTKNNMMDEAWQTVFATASFIQYPQDMLDECFEQQKMTYENYAIAYSMTYDDFMEATGIKEEDLLEAAKNSLQNMLTLDYICIKESINEDSEVYQNQMQTILEPNGFESKEAALEMGVSEWQLDFVVKYNCVLNFIVENAVVTEAAAE